MTFLSNFMIAVFLHISNPKPGCHISFTVLSYLIRFYDNLIVIDSCSVIGCYRAQSLVRAWWVLTMISETSRKEIVIFAQNGTEIMKSGCFMKSLDNGFDE